MRKVSLLAVSFLLNVVSCQKTNESSSEKNIFLPDDRNLPITQAYPWTAVGRLSNSGCTGTLIGKSLVLTAAHCLLPSEKDGSKGSFELFMKSGKHLASAKITKTWMGSSYPAGDRSKDWALAQLSIPLGLQYGWFGTDGTKPSVGDQVSLAGYSMDLAAGRSLSVHKECRIRGKENKLILHDCDSSRGASGAALFAWKYNASQKKYLPYIVGLHIGEFRGGAANSLVLEGYNSSFANCAISTNEFLPKASEILSAGN